MLKKLNATRACAQLETLRMGAGPVPTQQAKVEVRVEPMMLLLRLPLCKITLSFLRKPPLCFRQQFVTSLSPVRR